MTDARIPGEWIGNPIMDALSKGAWAILARGVGWSNQYGTDGFIPSTHMKRAVLLDDSTEQEIQELIEIDFLRRVDRGFQFQRWAESSHGGGLGQRNREDVSKQRDDASSRQRNFRERKKLHDAGDHSKCVPERCEIIRYVVEENALGNRDAMRSVTRDVGEGKGKGQGKGKYPLQDSKNDFSRTEFFELSNETDLRGAADGLEQMAQLSVAAETGHGDGRLESMSNDQFAAHVDERIAGLSLLGNATDFSDVYSHSAEVQGKHDSSCVVPGVPHPGSTCSQIRDLNS